MTILLIRHGQKEPFVNNPPLTQKGIEQAQRTAQFLKDRSFHAIYASPLHRTIHTAQIIAEYHPVNVEPEPRLMEKQSVNQKNHRWDIFWEGLKQQSHQRVALVTHGDIIVEVLRATVGDEALIEKHFESYEDLRDTLPLECSVTELDLTENGFEVKCLYSVDHLN